MKGPPHCQCDELSGSVICARCCTLCPNALVSRHHESRPFRTHRSLLALHSARQPARDATAHSTPRPFSHSSPDRNLLDNGPTYSFSLSPMTIRSSRFLPRPCTLFCAGRLALLLPVFFVLLTEDDSSDSKALGEQQSQFASHQWRFVGLSENERELSMRSYSSYYGYSPVPTNVAGSPASVSVTSQIKPPPASGVFKRLFGAYLSL